MLKILKMDYYLILFLFLSNINSFYCQEHGCYKYVSFMDDPICFNNILTFNQKKFQANNFAVNKNGDMVVQFSEDNVLSSSRLFYGFTKDGKHFFNNQSSYTKEINIDFNETKSVYGFYNYYGIYNSLNLFISLKNDTNKEKEYLFSINPEYSTVELYYFNNNNSTHYLWNFYNFFNLDVNDYIFPYKYVLFEVKKESTYFIAFIPKIRVYEDMINVTFVKKFRFKSFNIDGYEELNSLKYEEDYLYNRIINIFFMEDFGTFAILICGDRYYNNMVDIEYYGKCAFKFYNHNLRDLNYANYIDQLDDILYDFLPSEGDLFFKSIYLKNQYVIFAYYFDFYLDFMLIKINYQTELKKVSIIDAKKCFLFNFDIYESLNDFVKIDDKRVVFIYTSILNFHAGERSMLNTNRKLIILILDISSENKYLYLRPYLIFLEDIIPKMQISAHAYNGYLLFSTTAVLEEENRNFYYSNKYLSLFMKFGYADGKDYDNIDISIYLSDLEGGGETENFFDLLYNNLLIENNIFGYESDERIKLIFIPQEILILEQNYYTNRLIPLKNASYMYLDDEYILKQNKYLTKSSKYYYIDYQHIIREPEINYHYEPQIDPIAHIPGGLHVLNLSLADPDSNDYTFESRTYHGRTNRISFKLCHDYCDTCNELGISDNNKKCLSCLPLYQYDYWYYNKNSIENCVPEGHYIDLETHNLIQCNQTNYKYYINITDNKKICFKEEYDCPDSVFNSSTKECFYCDYFRFKNGECSFDDNNKTAEDIYETIKKELLLDYNNTDDHLKISTGNNFIYQVTSIDNELKYLKGNKKSNNSLIHLKECSDLLKKENGLDPDTDLIILKYENEEGITNGNEKSVQYEIYAPNSNTKLNLSVCSDVIIDIYIPIQLSEETQKLYEDLKAQGYNLFDKNDKFYNDICTPYESENDTDVLLSDRHNDFFEPNQLVCQANCEYSDYLPDSQYLKCRCNVVDEKQIEVKEPEKITAKSVVRSLYDVLKYSNYKVLKCYSLVFRRVTFTKNVGSILTNLYFIGYLITFIIFCYTKFNYLKKELEILFEERKIEENKEEDIFKDIPVIYLKNNNDNNNNDVKNNNNDNNAYKEDLKDFIEIKYNETKKRSLKNRKSGRNTALYRNNDITENNQFNLKRSLSIIVQNSDKQKNSIFENKDTKNFISNNKLAIFDEPISSINSEEKKESNKEINLKINSKEKEKDNTEKEKKKQKKKQKRKKKF